MATKGKRRRSVEQSERVLKEYRCLAHGPFEGYKPECPHGCNTVEREFRTAHAIGGSAKNIDRNLQALADDFKLTDLRNDMGSVMSSLKRGERDFAPTWGSLPNVKKGESGHAVATAIGGAKMSENVQMGDRGVAVFGQQIGAPRPHVDPKLRDMTPVNSVRAAE